MKSLGWLIGACALGAAGLLLACGQEEEEISESEARVEAQDPLQGAYEKQGGTPLHFVFKRDEDGKNGTFFGEIQIDGEGQRGSGTVKLSRDGLGTKMTLASQSVPTASTPKPGDAGVDSGAKPDTRPLAQQAFSGTMHYLKIGKNETILVRGDTNGKTAHYKKVRSWCANASDCKTDVQATGLECNETVTCNAASQCACR